ncbi:MAG: exopolysaccharide biosynthesis protein [Alphaproteobacteria bacterium]
MTFDGDTGPSNRTSDLIHAFAYGSDADPVTLHAVAASLRGQVLGFALLVFALPCCLPMPPGYPTVAGVIIILLAFHLIGGVETLWLPRWLARRTVSQQAMRRLADRVTPTIRQVERICRPRLLFLTGRVFKILIGAVVLVMGAILVLPIPFLGNLPPGFAAAVIGLALTTRDGIALLIGLALAAFAAAFTSTMAWAAVVGLRHAL